MRNSVNKLAFSPVGSKGDNSEAIMFLPLHGGGGASINVSSITKGNPTIVTLGSVPTCIGGQTVKLASVAGMTEINGYHEVLYVSGSTVALDVDSSAYTTYTSGGTMTFTHVADRFDNAGPFNILGTTTNLWANPGTGITADAAGNYAAKVTSGNIFNLVGYTGKVVFSADFKLNTAPTTASEFLFGIGVQAGTGTNSKLGVLSFGVSGASQNVGCYFRPETSADGGGTNTACMLGAQSTNQTCCQWVVDFGTDTIYAIKNGVLAATSTITRTNSLGNPDVTKSGATLGSTLDNALANNNKLGAGGSGGYVENLLWWKTTKSMSDILKVLNELRLRGEFPAHLL